MTAAAKTSSAQVPGVVEAGIGRCDSDREAALGLPAGNHVELAHRAEQLASVAEREQSWWAMLAGWVRRPDSGLSPVFAIAVTAARDQAGSDRMFWTETARYWQHRAAGLSHQDATEAAKTAATPTDTGVLS